MYPLTRTLAIVRALTTVWSDHWSRCDDRYALAALLRHLRDLAQSLVVDERQYGLQWLTRLCNDPAFVYRKFIVEGVSEALVDLASSTFEIKIDNALFRAVLGELPEEQRLTIYLADFEHFSEIEIAYIIGRPIEAVAGDLRTARHALREFIGHRARP